MSTDPFQLEREMLARAKLQNDPLLSRKEAAEYLGLAAHTLAVWHSTGRVKIPMIKVGRSVKYPKSGLDAFIKARLL